MPCLQKQKTDNVSEGGILVRLGVKSRKSFRNILEILRLALARVGTSSIAHAPSIILCLVLILSWLFEHTTSCIAIACSLNLLVR